MESSTDFTLPLISSNLHEDAENWSALGSISTGEKEISSTAEKAISQTKLHLKDLKGVFRHFEYNYRKETKDSYDSILEEIESLKNGIDSSKRAISNLKKSPSESETLKGIVKRMDKLQHSILNIEHVIQTRKKDFLTHSLDEELQEEIDEFVAMPSHKELNLPLKEELDLDVKKYPNLAWETDINAYSNVSLLDIDTSELLDADMQGFQRIFEGPVIPLTVRSPYRVPVIFHDDLMRMNGFSVNGKSWYEQPVFYREKNIKFNTAAFYESLIEELKTKGGEGQVAAEQGAKKIASVLNQSNSVNSLRTIYTKFNLGGKNPANVTGIYFDVQIDNDHVTIHSKLLYVLQDPDRDITPEKYNEYIVAKKTLILPLKSILALDLAFVDMPGTHLMETISPIVHGKEKALELLNDSGITEQLRADVDYWKKLGQGIKPGKLIQVDGEGNLVPVTRSTEKSETIDLFAKRLQSMINETFIHLTDLRKSKEVCTPRTYNAALEVLKDLEEGVKDSLKKLDSLLKTYGELEKTDGMLILKTQLSVLEEVQRQISLTRLFFKQHIHEFEFKEFGEFPTKEELDLEYPDESWESHIIPNPKIFTSSLLDGDKNEVIDFIKMYKTDLVSIVSGSKLKAASIFALDLGRLGGVKINQRTVYENKNPFVQFKEKESLEIYQNTRDIFNEMVALLGMQGAQRAGCLMQQGILATFPASEELLKKVSELQESQGPPKISAPGGLFTQLLVDGQNVTIINKALLTISSLDKEGEPVVHHYAIGKKTIVIPLAEIRAEDFDAKDNPIPGMTITEAFSELIPVQEKEKTLALLRRF